MSFNFDSIDAVLGGGFGVVGSPRLPLSVIDPNPENPRSFVAFDAEADWPLFVDSIRLNGVLEPIYVTPPNASGRYVLIRGHRRLRGAMAAGLQDVPVRYAEVASESTDPTSLYLDNKHRKGLHPIDEARFFKKVMVEQDLNAAQLGVKFSLSATMVHERLTLLAMPDELLDRLRATVPFVARAAYELASSYSENPELVRKAVVAGPVTVEDARQIRNAVRESSPLASSSGGRQPRRTGTVASRGGSQEVRRKAIAMVRVALKQLAEQTPDQEVAREIAKIAEERF